MAIMFLSSDSSLSLGIYRPGSAGNINQTNPPARSVARMWQVVSVVPPSIYRRDTLCHVNWGAACAESIRACNAHRDKCMRTMRHMSGMLCVEPLCAVS